jgi:hypothetical protein
LRYEGRRGLIETALAVRIRWEIRITDVQGPWPSRGVVSLDVQEIRMSAPTKRNRARIGERQHTVRRQHDKDMDMATTIG